MLIGELEAILGDGGMNTVRLRIWVNPEGGTNGLQYNLDLAKRFQNEGYKIYLDFHFSYACIQWSTRS